MSPGLQALLQLRHNRLNSGKGLPSKPALAFRCLETHPEVPPAPAPACPPHPGPQRKYLLFMIRTCGPSSCFKPGHGPQAGPLPSLSPSLAKKLGVSSFFRTRAGGRATVLLSASRPRFWAEWEERKLGPQPSAWFAPQARPGNSSLAETKETQSPAHAPHRPCRAQRGLLPPGSAEATTDQRKRAERQGLVQTPHSSPAIQGCQPECVVATWRQTPLPQLLTRLSTWQPDSDSVNPQLRPRSQGVCSLGPGAHRSPGQEP